MPVGSPVGLSEWHKPSGKNVESKEKGRRDLRAACKRSEEREGWPAFTSASSLLSAIGICSLVFESGLILAISGSHAFCSAAVQLSLPYSGLCSFS